MSEPAFIQLGALFISASEIIYVDFTDEHSCLLVLRSLDRGKFEPPAPQRFAQSEEIQFSSERPEHVVLRQWLAVRTTVLMPQHQQIVDQQQRKYPAAFDYDLFMLEFLKHRDTSALFPRSLLP